MPDEMIKLAKVLKGLKEKPLQQGICIGKVVEVFPRIKIATLHMVFDADMENLLSVEDITLKKGDKVVMMPTEEGQRYFLLGKVGEINVSSD